MNAEKIMDALNLLDDGMLAEVEILRGRKKKRNLWRKLLPMAACFGLVLAVVLVWSNVDKLTDGNPNVTSKPTMEQETQENLPAVDGTLDEEGSLGFDGNNDGGTNSIPETDGATDGGLEGVVEVPSVILRIDRMENGGFQGTVVEIVDTDVFPVGTEVTVEFLDSVTAGDLAEGDRVHVMFDGLDGSILYAENVWRLDE